MGNKLSILLLLFLGLLTACGTELQLYEWERMELQFINTQTQDTLPSESSINVDAFSMLVSLNPDNTLTVRSSDWINSSDGFQANDRIESIEITSDVDYNNSLPQGVLLNDVFEAATINNPELKKPLNQFIETFGQQSNQIEEGFFLTLLKPNSETAPRDSVRTFTVRLTLEKNGTFFRTSDRIQIFSTN
ncbi:MAG: hypothetical protein AAGI07_12180 [Bacteroidota bacterium]